MLKIDSLQVSYGAIRAVRNVSIELGKGEVVALLGPNGAGKSSLINAVVGAVKSSGSIQFEGQEISGLSMEERVRRGLTMTPEGRRIFANLTVAENLRLGAAVRKDPSETAREQERYLGMFPILGERINQPAGTLSGGEQQMLAIVRSLMSKPKLLMLDEPSLGLAPKIIEGIFAYIAQLKQAGLTLLLVEQNVTQALALADRAYVLASGEITMKGTGAELRADRSLIESYLGG